MAELADAQRSGRCLVYPSTGSTPASGIRLYRSCRLVGQCLLAYKSFLAYMCRSGQLTEKML